MPAILIAGCDLRDEAVYARRPVTVQRLYSGDGVELTWVLLSENSREPSSELGNLIGQATQREIRSLAYLLKSSTLLRASGLLRLIIQ